MKTLLRVRRVLAVMLAVIVIGCLLGMGSVGLAVHIIGRPGAVSVSGEPTVVRVLELAPAAFAGLFGVAGAVRGVKRRSAELIAAGVVALLMSPFLLMMVGWCIGGG